MAKRSRQRIGSNEIRQARPAAGEGGRSTTGRPSTTTTRRSRPVRRGRERGVLERYRGLLTVAAAAVGVLVIGILFFQSSARGAYTCGALLTPGPTEAPPTPHPTLQATPAPTATAGATATAEATATAGASPEPGTSPEPGASPSPEASPSPAPSPLPDPTARLGFTTTELGRNHVRDTSQTLHYAFCPPASGDHYNSAGVGPIRGDVYPPSQERSPGGWIHNLEHGYVVALYRCPTEEDCVSDAEMAELERFFAEAPDSPVAQSCPRKIVVARFDAMSTDFAVLAWDRTLLMDEFDVDTAITFAQQWLDHEAVPERGAC